MGGFLSIFFPVWLVCYAHVYVYEVPYLCIYIVHYS